MSQLNKKMSITFEIVDHYPNIDKPNMGTFHAYWEEMEMDFRGCVYFLKPKMIAVLMPTHKSFDEENKIVRYTSASFSDAEFNKRFFDKLRETFYIYAREKNLKFQKIPKKDPKSSNISQSVVQSFPRKKPLDSFKDFSSVLKKRS